MTKWEYKVLLVTEFNKNSLDTAKLQGEQISLTPTLNELGDEGWEIVHNHCMPVPGNLSLYFLFKRPKPEDVPSSEAPTKPDPMVTRRIDNQ